VALHARTAAQLYDGEARWEAIARLKQAVRSIPVLGNGDIWEAWDALRMMRSTGCDGVVVGRGCLGRPWLFRELADVFDGRQPENPPRFGVIAGIMLEHARRLVEWFGEAQGIRSFRKQSTWYTKGFQGSTSLRRQLVAINCLDDLELALSRVDPQLPFPPGAIRVPRGKSGGTQRVALPEGYLDDLEDAMPPAPEAESAVSGG
jgi:tRNA-dihydrouridine synthase